MNLYSNSSNFGSATLQSFMHRVYQWMAMGLVLTGAVAYWTSLSMPMVRFLAGGGIFLAMIVEIGLVIWLSASIMKISPRTAAIGFLVYSAVNGLTLSFIFLAYTGASIATTFFLTAGTFAGISLFAWVTKSDLTSMGSFLMMGLIGILIASVVNIFLKSPALYWIISYAGLAVFIGLTAYDTQRLKAIHQQGGGEAAENLAVIGALKLYLDFINLFIFLLRLFGRRRD